MKKPNHAPYYAFLYPALCELARNRGYALALHGTIGRDLDLIAVPWVDEAAERKILVQDFIDYALMWGGYVKKENFQTLEEAKPFGRSAYRIPMGAGAYIDLSVMGRKTDVLS